MNLNETWEECLRMWKWISEEWDGERSTEVMKLVYLEKFRPDAGYILSSCFFCNQVADTFRGCARCPGKRVDSKFNCENNEYHYRLKPKRFYQELLRLNGIRLRRI